MSSARLVHRKLSDGSHASQAGASWLPVTRPLLALTTVICLTGLHSGAQEPAAPEPADSLQKWIANQAVAIRSIDPNDFPAYKSAYAMRDIAFLER